jgi:hypothetical protein
VTIVAQHGAMTIDQRCRGTEVVFALHGSVSRQDVGELEALISHVGTADHITIDLRGARCDDAAVAMLAREAHRSTHLRILGLSQHQDRVLRYMGLHIRDS